MEANHATAQLNIELVRKGIIFVERLLPVGSWERVGKRV
jgi:hypothetical protein